MSNSFWKTMMKFNYICDVVAMDAASVVLMKLDIKKQHCSLFY